MNKKFFGIFLVASGFFLVIAITYIIFFHNFNPEEQSIIDISQIPSNQSNGGNQAQGDINNQATLVNELKIPNNQSAQEVDNATLEKSEIERVASLFVERYGSFSNQSDYANITDLYYFMTDEMKKREEQTIIKLRSKDEDGSNYYGVITKAVSSMINNYKKGMTEAQVSVQTKRQETENAKNSSYYQSAIVSLVKIGDSWKANELKWGKAETALK